MARAFTAKSVENLKPDQEKRLEVPDPGLTGLYLVVQPSGVKSWAVRYRHEARPRKMTLGRYPALSLADARRAASDVLQEVEHGRDPSSERKRAKAERERRAGRDQIGSLVEQYDRRHLSGLRRGKEVRRFLDRFAVEAWGDKEVQAIGKRDVLDLLDSVVESGRGTTANRLRAYLNRFFGWCVERDIIDVSPMISVRAPAKEVARNRVLTDDEIRWFWQACEAVGQPWGPMGKMLLLTGQRLGEVAAMTDAELQGDMWLLSSERTKNGRDHVVPLSTPVLDVLAAIQRVQDSRGYLHTTNGQTPVSGFHKARVNIAKHMAKLASDERGEPVDIEHFTWHDLRRTAATGMARLGIPVRVTEAVLNHVSGTGGGIVAVYQRHDYAEEKRNALDAWARFVVSLVEGEALNVLRMESAT